jgi:NADPH:quinone reductase-like Zn-dependent oxidoreductase
MISVSGCSGLNFQDLMVRQGAIDSPPKTPFILGFECSGEVEEIGEGVEDFKVSVTQMASNVSSSCTDGVSGCSNCHQNNCLLWKTTKSEQVSFSKSVCMVCNHMTVTDATFRVCEQ